MESASAPRINLKRTKSASLPPRSLKRTLSVASELAKFEAAYELEPCVSSLTYTQSSAPSHTDCLPIAHGSKLTPNRCRTKRPKTAHSGVPQKVPPSSPSSVTDSRLAVLIWE